MNMATAVFFAALSILSAISITKYLGKEYAWVNRKIIHFSIVPATLLYYFEEIPKEVFSLAALLFGIAQLYLHIKNGRLQWYQIDKNYGEVFFAFSAAIVAFFLPRQYATALLLVMAISDGVTGIIRFYYFRKRGYNVNLKKHWSGSVGYFFSSLLIAFFFLQSVSWCSKFLWSIILTFAEYQRFVDDNLSVPIVGILIGSIL
ncbi:hypothetical protein E3E22_05050 [Thermococcus sp. MV5]|nr:hypothetical protein [Thermococcus sp. MV5]NJE25994.1 hypothetical protein [Thermococcus sp. MV5]